jgi:hypothetical protein
MRISETFYRFFNPVAVLGSRWIGERCAPFLPQFARVYSLHAPQFVLGLVA